jgi:hypothetical protein
LRFGDAGGLGTNTTWIMAKNQEMVSGQGAVCSSCMESFLLPYFVHRTALLYILGVALCLPFPISLFFVRAHSLHDLSKSAFKVLSFLAVLILPGLVCLAIATLADRFLVHKVNRIILLAVATVEREPLRVRYPSATYALQVGLRFSDQNSPADEEIVSPDDA